MNQNFNSYPVRWKYLLIKYVATLATGDSIKDEDKSLYTDEIDAHPYISSKDIDLDTHKIDYNNGLYIKNNESKFKVAPAGCSLLCIEGGSAGRKIGLLNCSVSFVNKLCCFQPVSINGHYLYYWLQSKPFSDEFNMSITGLIGGVSRNCLLNTHIALPTDLQQAAIVTYLDHKATQIDKIVSSKQKLIELLQEKRTSVICQAVTKGLNRNVSMKNSGVVWLGDIPEDWDVVPAKALFSQSKETRHADDVQLTASQKYGIISQEDYMNAENSKIVLADKGLESWKHVEPNDFIISLRSFQGGLELSNIIGCITWHYIVLKPQQWVYPEYFKWLFKSTRYIEALQRTANFIRDGQDLRLSNFVQVPLPHIPINEQREIAEYLNRKTASIDRVIADVTEQIEKFKEYRQSVISEVATGKVAIENAN
jgi:type I restriction enzyme S subunit